MDGSRFDLWTRRRFGRLAGGTLAALLGAIAPQKTEAKKRRKKKRRKPPQQRCQSTRQACSTSGEPRCCGSLVCDDNGCVGDPVCLQSEGGPCGDGCDCRLGLECSERTGNTCRQCSLPQMPCESAADCCLNTSFCATNACADPQSTYCCQGLGASCSAPCDCCPNPGNCGLNGCGGVDPMCCRGQGFPCESSCDCCDPLRCVNATCQ
ncbi:MAG: hypothetical protein ACRDJC_22615 [Thermomicrobiales bacterium]